MKKLSAKRPSPALIVAFIALFVALSGTGYAVKRSSIGSSALKRNAVTSSKIKKNAVVTSKIKKDNVTGDKILESSLGKVPDADKLDGSDSSAFERSSKFTRVASFSLGNNENKEIYTLGPFKLTATCKIAQEIFPPAGADDEAAILISSSADGSVFDGDGNIPTQGPPVINSLGPATAEANRQFVESGTFGDPSGTPELDAESDGTAIALDGTQFVAQLWAGSNILNQPGKCSFGGLIEQVS